MAVLLWIWNILSPIITILGLLYICGNVDELKGWEFIVGGMCALIGLIIGFTGWAETVPPRWFWVKSKTDLVGSRVGTAFSYALQFFLIPFAIMCIIYIVEMA